MIALAVVCSTILTLPAGAADQSDPGRYREFGDAGGFLNIIAPGQSGDLTPEQLTQVQNAVAANDPSALPPHYADQRAMYDALVRAKSVTDANLTDYFKDASFGVKADDVDRVYHPGDNKDVTVVRDKSFGIPHIYGRTRYATMFAEGYATAEDRLVFLDVLRHVGRGTLSELVGTGLGRDSDAATMADTPYREQDLREQLDNLRKMNSDGATAVDDITAYAAGVNAYIAKLHADPSLLPAEYQTLGKTPEPWLPTDSVAVAANVGGIFGKGGGRELQNACGLQKMVTNLGDATKARTIFDDLHFTNDPQAPTTAQQSFPYMTNLGDPNPDATPILDCSRLSPSGGAASPDAATTPAPPAPSTTAGLGGGGIDVPTVPASITAFLTTLNETRAAAADAADPRTAMSNAILIAGTHTANGRPIAVFGPQVGYNQPALLVEKDVHGPGIDARGVAFIGTDMWVQLGRGTNYAWSATSSGADNVDTFVLKLCDPAGGAATATSTGYEHDGRCRPIETFDHVVNAHTGVGQDSPSTTLTWHVERAPEYGPISRRGTLPDGTPVAIAVQRSTYGRELSSGIGFKRLNDPQYMANGVSSFNRAAGTGIDYTFNWFYIDASTIAYEHSCRCPQRAKGVDPDLPNWGTGKWDWNGWLGADRQPHEANPSTGYITSWNNKQAPDFRAADSDWGFGPVHRVQMLNARIDEAFAKKEKLTRPAVVSLMEDAATVDLRGQEVLPKLLEILQGDPPAGADPRVLAMRETLELWMQQGAHRVDRNGDGAYDDPVGPAIMDTWFDVLSRTTYAAPTGSAFASLQLGTDDSPRGHGGSAFFDGFYSQIRRDLDRILSTGSGKTTGSDTTTKPSGSSSTSADATTSTTTKVPLPDASPGAGPYCGADLDACRATLWASLSLAAQTLAAPRGVADPSARAPEYLTLDSFGTPTVESWQRLPADDEIQFDSLVAGNVPMAWVNRPTFQQVVQLETATRARPAEDPSGSGSGDDGPNWLVIGAIALAVVAIGVGVSAVRRRRHTPSSP